MKKYLFAALTLIICLFVLTFINVLVMRGSGVGAGMFVICGLTLGATRFVYRKYRDEENLKNYGTTDISEQLLKSDREGFEEAFSKINSAHAGIKEVLVTNGKDGISDFIIGIRTEGNIKPNYELIKTELYKTFYPQIKFVFINLDEMGEEGRKMFSAGAEIKGQ